MRETRARAGAVVKGAELVEDFVDGFSVCDALVIDRLTERPEVADVNTSVVYEHLRNHVIEPLALAARASARRETDRK